MIYIKRIKFVYLLPLFAVEIYLLMTLVLLTCGPVKWGIHNEIMFWIFIFMYHMAFIYGYLGAISKHQFGYIVKLNETSSIETWIVNNFWWILILATVASIVMYKNGVNNSSLIPYNIFDKVSLGLSSLSQARSNFNATYYTSPQNSLYITAIYAVTAVFRYSVLPLTIYLWRSLSFFKKIVAMCVSLFPILITFSTGTNAYTLFIILVAVISFCVIILRKYYLLEKIKHSRLILGVVVSLLLFIFIIFLSVMSSRMPVSSFKSLESSAPHGDVVFSENVNNDKVTASFAKIDFYIAQGYYGMSLALDKKFDTTYGLGSSLFVLGFVDKHLGFNLNENTYQYKVNDQWNEYSSWHSFYSQEANDFSFYGVIIVMFVLGYLFANIYISSVVYNNIFAKLLLPLFVIMFLFISMNNQVFNNMEFLISFVVLIVLWFKLKFNVRILI